MALVRDAILQIICQDVSDVLRSMSRSLDTIELELHNDETLQRTMPVWREQLGKWKNALFHQGRSIEQMTHNSAALNDGLEGSAAGGEVGGASTPNRAGVANSHHLERRMGRIGADVKNTYSRIESTFQALMSSITIVESERAIKEAESVSRLSQLAFFFIPLSLVATLFGMNVNVSERGLPQPFLTT